MDWVAFAKMAVEAGALGGVVMPYLIAVANQPSWPSWTRTLTTYVLCVVGGVLTAVGNGLVTSVTGLSAAVTICLASTIKFYHAWHKGAGLTNAIEQATSPSRSPLPSSEGEINTDNFH